MVKKAIARHEAAEKHYESTLELQIQKEIQNQMWTADTKRKTNNMAQSRGQQP